MKKLMIALAAMVVFTGCVSRKKYDALEFTKKELEKSNAECKDRLEKAMLSNDSLTFLVDTRFNFTTPLVPTLQAS